MASRAHLGLALLLAGDRGLGWALAPARRAASRPRPMRQPHDGVWRRRPQRASAEGPMPAASGGLSAPIAAARGEHGDVVVAGLDVAAHAIRVQRISAKDEVVADRTVLDGVAVVLGVRAQGGRRRRRRRGHVARASRREARAAALVLGPDLAPEGRAHRRRAGVVRDARRALVHRRQADSLTSVGGEPDAHRSRRRQGRRGPRLRRASRVRAPRRRRRHIARAAGRQAATAVPAARASRRCSRSPSSARTSSASAPSTPSATTSASCASRSRAP